MNAIKTLRLSIVTQWILTVVLIWVHFYDAQRMPELLKRYLEGVTSSTLSTPTGKIAMFLSIFVVIAGISGSIGTFLLKPWGRWFYLIAVVFTPVLALSKEIRIWGPYESMLCDVLIPLEGFTVALLYFSEASRVFQRSDS